MTTDLGIDHLVPALRLVQENLFCERAGDRPGKEPAGIGRGADEERVELRTIVW
jgi:hypothetical protein